MKQNSITTAPQVADGASMYARWFETHTGTIADFYDFITTPGGDRTAFLAGVPMNREITSRLLTLTYKC